MKTEILAPPAERVGLILTLAAIGKPAADPEGPVP
jgi:hypothetical protein